MHPYISVLGRSIPMYGVMAALGCVLAVIYFKLAERRCPELQRDSELAFIWSVVGTLVGAKLLSVLTLLPEICRQLPLLFSDTRLFLQKYVQGGFVYYGGLYGAMPGLLIYCRHSRIKYFPMVRLLLPTVPLIHGLGRIGCHLMGCCYGCETSLPLGVVFEHSEIAPNGVSLLPVQLIGAAAELAMFALLAFLSRKRLGGRQLLRLYLSYYGLGRFVLEFFRGDEVRGFVGALSVSQWISVVTVAIAAFVLRPKRKSE